MSKKKISQDIVKAVSNDLDESSYFEAPQEKPKVDVKKETNKQINKVTNEIVEEIKTVHHTFDIYEEQLLDLKKIKLDKHRDKVTISSMVRDALDQYINKEKNK